MDYVLDFNDRLEPRCAKITTTKILVVIRDTNSKVCQDLEVYSCVMWLRGYVIQISTTDPIHHTTDSI